LLTEEEVEVGITPLLELTFLDEELGFSFSSELS